MKMRDFDDWPPTTFSVTGSIRGAAVPVYAQEIRIGVVQFIQDTSVMFKRRFDSNKYCTCTIFVPNRTTANKVARILSKYFGANLLSIDDVEFPTD
jgi:hypothetical protein